MYAIHAIISGMRLLKMEWRFGVDFVCATRNKCARRVRSIAYDQKKRDKRFLSVASPYLTAVGLALCGAFHPKISILFFCELLRATFTLQ